MEHEDSTYPDEIECNLPPPVLFIPENLLLISNRVLEENI
jgi:hypothetical protein